MWLNQWLTMLASGAIIAVTFVLGGWIYGVIAWLGMPALGLISAYRATRRGLLNYAAWIVPPVSMCAAHLLIWGYAPGSGPVLLCALISLVGAAAGEVMNQRENGK